MTDSYFEGHLSMSEWVQRAGLQASHAILQEDSNKRSRLDILTEGWTYPHSARNSSGPLRSWSRHRAFVPLHAKSAPSSMQRAVARRAPVSRCSAPVARRSTISRPGSAPRRHRHLHIQFRTARRRGAGSDLRRWSPRVAGEAIEGSLLALNSGTFRGPVLGLRASPRWRMEVLHAAA